MIKFENGRHLANYILKILRNTSVKVTSKDEMTIKKISHLLKLNRFVLMIL